MTNRSKIQKFLNKLDGKSEATLKVIADFDAGAKALRDKLETDITIVTLNEVNEKINKLRKSINMNPLLEEIENLQSEFKSYALEILKEIEDKTNEIRTTIKAKEKETEEKINSVIEENKDIKKELFTISKSNSENIKKITGELSVLNQKLPSFANREQIAEKLKKLENWDNTEELKNYTDKTRTELLNIITARGGGQAHRQIKVGGVDVLTKYTDINLVAGTNVTLTTANDNTDKNVDITITATGSIDGSGTANQIAYWVDVDTLGALTVATYPSLTELSYVKGVTSALQTQLDGKQATLVSGTNIKTINSTSLLGSGDISISASPGGSDTQVQFNDGGAFAGDAQFTFNKTSGLTTITGAGNTGVALFKAAAGSGASFAQINDNGTMVLDSDVGTGSVILTLKYNGSNIHTFQFDGQAFIKSRLNLTDATASINWGSGRAYEWASATGTMNWGLSENGSATPQAFIHTLAESSRGGTDTNVAGANVTIRPGNGTGTGGSGSIIFQTAPAGASGTTANTMATVMTILKSGFIGVNTTNPQTHFDVQVASNRHVAFFDSASQATIQAHNDGAVALIPLRFRGSLFTFGDSGANSSNVGIGTATFGTNAAAVFAMFNGTAPSTSPADVNQIWSADTKAGDSNLYARNEAGTTTILTNIKANGRATAQTAANASVATYTVGSADGSFIISSNVLVTTSSAENFTVTCAYTDEGNTARTLTLNFQLVGGVIGTAINFANGAVPYEGLAVHIRAKASTTITIATTGTFTGATYNVEGTIRQIS